MECGPGTKSPFDASNGEMVIGHACRAWLTRYTQDGGAGETSFPRDAGSIPAPTAWQSAELHQPFRKDLPASRLALLACAPDLHGRLPAQELPVLPAPSVGATRISARGLTRLSSHSRVSRDAPWALPHILSARAPGPRRPHRGHRSKRKKTPATWQRRRRARQGRSLS